MNKKLLLNFTALCLFAGSTFGRHIPAQGPLQLEDALYSNSNDRGCVNAAQAHSAIPGVMTLALRNHKNVVNLRPLLQFFNVTNVEDLPSYQDIISILANHHDQTTIGALQVIVDTLFGLYNYNGYINCQAAWPLNKVRMIWLSPTSYVNPKAYFVETDPILKQILKELDQVATIIMRHSISQGLQLKAHIWHTYYFRAPITITALACATAIAVCHVESRR